MTNVEANPVNQWPRLPLFDHIFDVFINILTYEGLSFRNVPLIPFLSEIPQRRSLILCLSLSARCNSTGNPVMGSFVFERFAF